MNDAMPKTSSGARLLQLLREAGRLKPEMAIGKVWAAVLGLNPNSNADALRATSSIIELVRDTQKDIQKLDDIDEALYLRPLEKLENLLGELNLAAPWTNLQSRIDPATMTGLEYCAEALTRASTEEVLDLQQLDEIRQALDDLFSKILDSHLERDLEVLLISKIEEIRRAIVMYRVFGASVLKDVLQNAVGALVLAGDQVKEPDDKEAVSRFLDVAIKIQTAVQNALKLGALIRPITRALLGPGSGEL